MSNECNQMFVIASLIASYLVFTDTVPNGEKVKISKGHKMKVQKDKGQKVKRTKGWSHWHRLLWQVQRVGL